MENQIILSSEELEVIDLEIKAHRMGLHGYGDRVWLVIDTQANGFSTIAFRKSEDAQKLIQVRKDAGWTQFEIRECLIFEDAFVDVGPTIVEKRKKCPLCQEMTN